jgi:choline dehydrogenase-like flavoprotein
MATKKTVTKRETATATATTTDWLSAEEMATLEAICDALIPSVSPPAGEDDPHGLYARKASDLHVALLMADALAHESSETHAQLKQLLGIFRSPLFGALTLGLPGSFTGMSAARRERALRAMSTSRTARLRQGFQALKRLAAFAFYSAPVEGRHNPNWPAIGYTPAPPPPSPDAAPKRIRTLDVSGDLTLTADVVIVGSGAGGGRMAAELAAAGKDVLVLEKGGYFGEADFSGLEAEMTPELYLRRGTLATVDLGMVVLAGSCLGGGTIVNWSTSLRTPPHVLEEWEREHGVTGVTSAEYAEGFATAEERLGITIGDSQPNRNNAALQRGCKKLGYDWGYIPRNASDCRQRCGACGYGCPYGRKQSTMLTYLQDAHDRGARILPRCTVERVTIQAGRATGVAGWASDSATGERRAVVVHAPLVVVAGGAVESPALLKRSGLTNPNIGRHLRLHPVVNMAGYYEEPVEAWTGSLQTIYSMQFADLKDHHGVWFEVAPAHPGLFGLGTPWDGGQAHKSEMRRIAHEAVFIILARDTGEGHITLDKRGDPVIHYWPSEADRKHLIRGLQEVTRIAFAGGAYGAATLFTPVLRLESENRKPGAVSEKQLAAFIAEIGRRQIIPNRPTLFTAHQMGTCRMGASAKTAATDPYGEVYGVRGLFVADGSLMPTAAGVNPMLSIYALSHRVAQYITSRG